MGENCNAPRLFVDVCGEWMPVSLTDLTETLAAMSSAAEISREILLEPITISLRLPKYFRCRSRKRLIKLLMANKFDRGSAERMARMVCASGMSYQAAWQQIWPQLIRQ